MNLERVKEKLAELNRRLRLEFGNLLDAEYDRIAGGRDMPIGTLDRFGVRFVEPEFGVYDSFRRHSDAV